MTATYDVDVPENRGDPAGDPPPIVARTVARLSRHDPGRAAIESFLRWHGPDSGEVVNPEVPTSPLVSDRGKAALRSMLQRDFITRERVDDAIRWVGIVEEWCHTEIAEFTMHLGSTDDTGFGRVGPMATAIVEARIDALRDVDAVRLVLDRLHAATTLDNYNDTEDDDD